MIKEVVVELEPTVLCNLECSYCPRKKIHRMFKARVIDMSIIEKLSAKVSKRNIVWYSGMGEPTLHFDLPNITRVLKKNNPYVYMNTNARTKNFNKVVNECIDNGLDFVNVSVHGLFKNVVQNIRNVSKKVNTRVSVVVTNDTPKNIRETIRKLTGVDNIRLQSEHHRAFACDTQKETRCDYMKNYLFIACDGYCYPCVNDVSGCYNLGIFEDDIYDLKVEKYPYDMCEHCDMPLRVFPYDENTYIEKLYDLGKI